jgi:alkanesulfonate monooxygenase SsuD/methylene tetrahydromethanopterin reductase-like flavin-dependent oxidoreductase (luciferase family)
MLPSRAQGDHSTTTGDTGWNTIGSTAWLTELCKAAEGAGAGGLWATDHLFWGQPTLECLTSLAVAAAATRDVAIGSCVLQLPLRSPAAVAKQAAALQLLSGGRLVLGVGVGSHEREYELAGVDYATRGRRLDASLAAIRRAWAGTGGVADTGYRMEPLHPAPVWIGGSSPAALRRAGTAGDGWIPLFLEPAAFSAALSRLRAVAAGVGRPGEAVTPAVVMVAAVGGDTERTQGRAGEWLSNLYGIPAKAFARHLVVGSPERCAERARRYLDAGAEHVAVMIAGDDAVDQFAAISSSVEAPEGSMAPSLVGVGS